MDREEPMKNYPKLDPVVKQKILSALRSNKYTYCKESLFNEIEDDNGQLIGAHCALGVIYNTFGVKNDMLQGKGNISVRDLPENVRNCIGIFACPNTSDSEDKYVGEEVFKRNDRSGSYEDATNWIERNL